MPNDHRGVAGWRTFIGLGSNMGDRLQWLRRALLGLSHTAGIDMQRVSSVYETEPIGPIAQAWFLNAVVELLTTLEPMALLTHTQRIELALERMRPVRWGPRTIDLDILLYGDLDIQSAALRVPHPELRNRAFVMVPLLELAPDITLPDGTRVSHHLQALTPHQTVRRIAPAASLTSPLAPRCSRLHEGGE